MINRLLLFIQIFLFLSYAVPAFSQADRGLIGDLVQLRPDLYVLEIRKYGFAGEDPIIKDIDSPDLACDWPDGSVVRVGGSIFLCSIRDITRSRSALPFVVVRTSEGDIIVEALPPIDPEAPPAAIIRAVAETSRLIKVPGPPQVERVPTGNHHCPSNCRGEPTRTSYPIVLTNSDPDRFAFVGEAKLECVSGPCSFSQVTIEPYRAGENRFEAAIDVWSHPTTWILTAETEMRDEIVSERGLTQLQTLKFGDSFSFRVMGDRNRIRLRGETATGAFSLRSFEFENFDLFDRVVEYPDGDFWVFEIRLREKRPGEPVFIPVQSRIEELAKSVLDQELQPYKVVYYSKRADQGVLTKLIQSLPDYNIEAKILASTKKIHLNDSTNYIWCGTDVPLELVKYIAMRVMGAGFELYNVSGFPKKSAERKRDLIEVGAVVPSPGAFITPSNLDDVNCDPF